MLAHPGTRMPTRRQLQLFMKKKQFWQKRIASVCPSSLYTHLHRPALLRRQPLHVAGREGSGGGWPPGADAAPAGPRRGGQEGGGGRGEDIEVLDDCAHHSMAVVQNGGLITLGTKNKMPDQTLALAALTSIILFWHPGYGN